MQEIKTTSPGYFEANENYHTADFARQAGQGPLRRQIQQRFMPPPPPESMFKAKRREKELQTNANSNAALKSRPVRPIVSSAVRLGIEKPPGQQLSNAPKPRELLSGQTQRSLHPARVLSKSVNEPEPEPATSEPTQAEMELAALREEFRQLQEAFQASEMNHKQEMNKLQASMIEMESNAEIERANLSSELEQIQKEKEDLNVILAETRKKLDETQLELQAEVVRGGAIRAASEKLASEAKETGQLKVEIEALKTSIRKNEIEASVNNRESERYRLDCERLKLVLDAVEKELLESKKEKELLAEALKLEGEKISLQRKYLLKKNILCDI